MNPQSVGEIKLSSTNPADSPLIDPSYLDNNFDALILRESISETLKLMRTPMMKKYSPHPIIARKSDTNEDIEVNRRCLTFGYSSHQCIPLGIITQNVASIRHPSRTIRIGKSEHDGSCVDGDLKIHGLEGVRVADFSVASILPRYVITSYVGC
jgi:choline dehydrogenase